MRSSVLWLTVVLAAAAATRAAAQEAAADPVTFEFAGNEKLATAGLASAVAGEAERYAASGRNEGVLDDAAFLLERHYRRRGFRGARVSYEVPDPGSRRVVFRIDEGAIWTMAGPIEFVPRIETPGFAEFWERTSIYAPRRYVTSYPIYDENRIANDLDAAKDFLIEAGWTEVRFVVDSSEAGPAARMRVVVRVDFGPRTLLGSIRFEGETLVGPIVLLSELGLVPWPDRPVPFHDDRAVQWKIALVRFYRSKGHFQPAIDVIGPEIAAVGPGERRADIVFRIDPGPRHRIGRIRVEGNEHLSTTVILQAFDVEPGEWYSARRIEEGRSDLIRLDLFQTVAVVEERTEAGAIDLVVLVEEKPRASFGIDLGFGIFERVRAGAEFHYNDLFGTGRGFVVRGSASDRRRRAEVKFVDPLPFGDGKNRIEVGPFVERQDREPFVLNRYGAEFDLARDVGEDLELEVGWTWEISDLRHLGDGLELSGEDDHVFSGPRVSIEWDKRNDPLLPTSGYRLGVSLDSSLKAFGATKDLIGAGVRAEFYYPVWNFQGYPVVFFAGLRGEVVQPILGARSVPIQKRLFEGGENSVRSFEPDRLSPLNFLETPIGGEVAVVANLETRFNIWRDLWGVVFADIGFVDSNLEEFGKEPPGLGFGAGLRYLTPIGPIRLEVAYNPDHDRSDDDDAVEVVFTIGFKF